MRSPSKNFDPLPTDEFSSRLAGVLAQIDPRSTKESAIGLIGMASDNPAEVLTGQGATINELNGQLGRLGILGEMASLRGIQVVDPVILTDLQTGEMTLQNEPLRPQEGVVPEAYGRYKGLRVGLAVARLLPDAIDIPDASAGPILYTPRPRHAAGLRTFDLPFGSGKLSSNGPVDTTEVEFWADSAAVEINELMSKLAQHDNPRLFDVASEIVQRHTGKDRLELANIISTGKQVRSILNEGNLCELHDSDVIKDELVNLLREVLFIRPVIDHTLATDYVICKDLSEVWYSTAKPLQISGKRIIDIGFAPHMYVNNGVHLESQYNSPSFIVMSGTGEKRTAVYFPFVAIQDFKIHAG